MSPVLSIDLGIDELTLLPGVVQAKQSRLVVRVDPAGLTEESIQTSPITLSQRGSAIVNWSYSIPLQLGAKAWEQLRKGIMNPGKLGNICFTLCSAVDPRGASIGSARVDLQQLSRENSDAVGRRLFLADSSNRRVGTLVVFVRALNGDLTISNGTHPAW